MINWIKYAPLGFFHGQERSEVGGPNPIRHQYTLYALGSKLTFKCPRHPLSIEFSELEYRRKTWVTDSKEKYHWKPIETGAWEEENLFLADWNYRWAWFAGNAGSITLQWSIYRRKPKTIPRNISYLHPRAFENAVANWLDHNYSGYDNYRAPLNWSPRLISGVHCVVLDTRPDKIFRHIFIPVENDVLLVGTCNAVAMQYDEPRTALAEECIKEIINSITFTPSEKILKKILEMKKEVGDMRLRDEFPPLKWPIPEEALKRDALPYKEQGAHVELDQIANS